jgi:HEAT repeat protein
MGWQSVRGLAALLVVLCAAWLFAVLALRRGYLDLFRQRIRRAAFSAELLDMGSFDLAAFEAMMDALSSPEPQRVLAALRLLDDAQRARLVPALILYHDDVTVLVRSLEMLAEAGGAHWLPHAERLVRHASEEVRVAALSALTAGAPEARLRTAVGAALEDPSPAVRARAAAIAGRVDHDVHPLDRPLVTSLLAASEDDPRLQCDLRLALIEAFRPESDHRWTELLLACAESPDPEIVRRVAAAMGRIKDPRFLPHLIGFLGLRAARNSVRAALVEMGAAALDALAVAIDSRDTPAAVRLHIPRSMAAFRSQLAVAPLMTILASEHRGAIRYKALRGLIELARVDGVEVPREPAEDVLRTTLVEHLHWLGLTSVLTAADAALTTRSQHSGELLRALVGDKSDLALARCFRVFQLIHPTEDVAGIARAAASDDARKRANALEFSDTLALDGDEVCRELLAIAIDDLPAAEKVTRAADHVPAPPADETSAWRVLLDESDEAVVLLTANHILAHPAGPLTDAATHALATADEPGANSGSHAEAPRRGAARGEGAA